MRKEYKIAVKYEKNYFCIESLEDNNEISIEAIETPYLTSHVHSVNYSKYFDIKYSYDQITWYNWSNNITLNTNNKLYFKGNNNDLVYDFSLEDPTPEILNAHLVFISTKKVAIYGKISTLFNEGMLPLNNKNISFGYGSGGSGIFINGLNGEDYDWLKIEDASNFELNIEYLNAPQLFAYISSLKYPPKLPALHAADSSFSHYNGYEEMFIGCENLEKLPKLKLVSGNCAEMFSYCTKIKISETKTGIYQNDYYISNFNARAMFSYTGGTFTGTPTNNTTYYTSNEVI